MLSLCALSRTGSKRSDLAGLARVLTERLQTRYGLPVSVSEPLKTGGQVSTWKLTIETELYWAYLTQVVEDLARKSMSVLKNGM